MFCFCLFKSSFRSKTKKIIFTLVFSFCIGFMLIERSMLSRGVKTVSLPFYRRLIKSNQFFSSSLRCSTLPFHPSNYVIRKTNPSRKSTSVRSQTQRTLNFNVNTINQVNWKFKGWGVLRSGLPNPSGRTNC